MVQALHQVALTEAGIDAQPQQGAGGDRALELGLLNYRNALQHMRATYLSKGLGPAQHQVLAAHLSSNAVSSLVKWGSAVGEIRRTNTVALQKRVDDASTESAAHRARIETVSETVFLSNCTFVGLHSYTHTLIHSYTHTLIHSHTHTLTYSYFTHSYTHILIHSYSYPLIHSYSHPLILYIYTRILHTLYRWS
jgi:hypothetical protein